MTELKETSLSWVLCSALGNVREQKSVAVNKELRCKKGEENDDVNHHQINVMLSVSS